MPAMDFAISGNLHLQYWGIPVCNSGYFYLTINTAEYLVEREIKLLALDFPMCGDPRDGMDFVPEDTIVPDTILYDAGIPCVVGLTAVEELPEEVFFCGCPLKLIGTDGAPLRAFAIEF